MAGASVSQVPVPQNRYPPVRFATSALVSSAGYSTLYEGSIDFFFGQFVSNWSCFYPGASVPLQRTEQFQTAPPCCASFSRLSIPSLGRRQRRPLLCKLWSSMYLFSSLSALSLSNFTILGPAPPWLLSFVPLSPVLCVSSHVSDLLLGRLVEQQSRSRPHAGARLTMPRCHALHIGE